MIFAKEGVIFSYHPDICLFEYHDDVDMVMTSSRSGGVIFLTLIILKRPPDLCKYDDDVSRV